MRPILALALLLQVAQLVAAVACVTARDAEGPTASSGLAFLLACVCLINVVVLAWLVAHGDDAHAEIRTYLGGADRS